MKAKLFKLSALTPHQRQVMLWYGLPPLINLVLVGIMPWCFFFIGLIFLFVGLAHVLYFLLSCLYLVYNKKRFPRKYKRYFTISSIYLILLFLPCSFLNQPTNFMYMAIGVGFSFPIAIYFTRFFIHDWLNTSKR